jgi:hypothetical protein
MSNDNDEIDNQHDEALREQDGRFSVSDERQVLRALTRGAYDLQHVRVEMGNRLCQAFRVRLGIKPGEKETDEEEAKDVLDTLRSAYKKITDGVVKELPTMKQFSGNEIISTYTELCLVAEYISIEREEGKHFRRLGQVLETIPIWTSFLKSVKGCGPAMAAVVISEIDITKATYPSSIWKYAGLDVAGDGKGRSRRKEHLVRVKYKDKKGKEQERDSITFNPWLKTKLYVLASCFLKSNSPYREQYDNYKHRLETMPQHAEKTKGHRHSMAMRVMIKQFLADLYNAWRPLEGLEIAPTYYEAKSGRKHHGGEEAA